METNPAPEESLLFRYPWLFNEAHLNHFEMVQVSCSMRLTPRRSSQQFAAKERHLFPQPPQLLLRVNRIELRRQLRCAVAALTPAPKGHLQWRKAHPIV